VIPHIKYADLSSKETAILTRLLGSPHMWPFALLAADVGFDEAVVLCASREISDSSLAKLAEGFYTVDDLPSGRTIRLLIWACRLQRRREGRIKNKEVSLQEVAEATGGTLGDAVEALRLFREIAPTSWDRGVH